MYKINTANETLPHTNGSYPERYLIRSGKEIISKCVPKLQALMKLAPADTFAIAKMDFKASMTFNKQSGIGFL